MLPLFSSDKFLRFNFDETSIEWMIEILKYRMYCDLHRPKIIYSICNRNILILSTAMWKTKTKDCSRRYRHHERSFHSKWSRADTNIWFCSGFHSAVCDDDSLPPVMSYAFIMCAICHIPPTTMVTPMLHKMREINIEKKNWQTTIAPGPTSNNVFVPELRVAWTNLVRMANFVDSHRT